MCGFYNVKSSVKLSALLLISFAAACTAAHDDAIRPWTVAVKTEGGIAGRGAGDYAVDSHGRVTAKLFDGRDCTFTMDVAAIDELLSSARPREWKESYVPENQCCDRIHYTLTYDDAGVKTVTSWIDDPLPMPADLVALSNAIVGGDAASVRSTASERCR